MDHEVLTLVKDVEVCDPVDSGNLQVFGLRHKQEPKFTYTLLDDAIAAGTVDVTEVNESGSVPNLKIKNKGDTWVFLMAGEILDGAKQNRALNASMMVADDSETVIPVSCVEQGRWGYKSARFRGTGRSSHSKLRRIMSRDAGFLYKQSGRPGSDQGVVWKEVSDKLKSVASFSPSSSLHQAYLDHEKNLAKAFDSLNVPEDCTGVVFAINGKIAGVDVFDRPETLKKLFPKLLRSYAIDAIDTSEESAKLDAASVSKWLKSAADAQSTRFKSPGMGEDIRIEGNEHVGACLVVESKPVHGELFPAEDETP